MRITKTTLAICITILSLASAGAVGTLIFAWPVAPDRPNSPPAATVRDNPGAGSSSAVSTPAAVAAAFEALKTLGNVVGPQTARTDRGPAFDVARIEPSGEAVIAGRAAPGAVVEFLRGGEAHDRTVANPSGEFVLVPKPLPPGNYNLTLRATQPDGKVLMSKDSVAVALRAGNEDKPVVALVVPDKPAVVLSKPATDAATALAIDAVEAEAGGRLYVSGRSAPGTSVRLYLNDAYIASATASAEGRVAFAIRNGVKPGDYRVRLDQVDASSSVRSRAEVPFNAPATAAALASPAAPPVAPSESASRVAAAAQTTPAPRLAAAPPIQEPVVPQTTPKPRDNANAPVEQPPAVLPAASEPTSQPPALADVMPPRAAMAGNRTDVVVVPSVDTTVVTRGDNLWRISRTTYGDGVRYSVIYAANRKQIRDPDLIYPGQIFVLPKALPKQ